MIRRLPFGPHIDVNPLWIRHPFSGQLYKIKNFELYDDKDNLIYKMMGINLYDSKGMLVLTMSYNFFRSFKTGKSGNFVGSQIHMMSGLFKYEISGFMTPMEKICALEILCESNL
ncbi:MAG: hypothetical protein K5694_02965 [Bacilli bacterium]|nr:hypothetical protein [Bacilli bacterium]